MSGLLLGLAFALLASVGLNLSYLLQHGGVAHTPDITLRRPVASMRGVLTSRLWLAGAAVGTAGWAMHILALTKAPLSLVQAFLAGGLALVVPLAAKKLGHRVARSEVGAIALMTLALVGLTLGLDGSSDHHRFATGPMLGYLAVSALLAAAVAAAIGGGRRAHALGLAGGILYGAADVSIKGLTGILRDDGVLGVLTSGWLLAAAVLCLTAFFSFARGLQTGRALPVIALMTAGTNVVSIIGGFAVFGDSLGRTLALSVLHLVCFVLVGVAAWLLAPVQAALTVRGEQAEAESAPGAPPTPRGRDAAPAPSA